jgi:hypothetical protein
MKIELYTDLGQTLINEIFNAVEKETVKTWVVRKDEKQTKYLTHKPEQWIDKALFGLENEKGKIVISLVWWIDKEPTEDIKCYYIGRLTELLLVNFSSKFGKFEIIK